MSDLSQLEKELAITFRDKNLLKQACVHRSYLNENPSFPLDHNERLEFLGDAVLELVVTEYLYNTYPDPEGELTNWRAALVNAKMMAIVAKNLNIEDYLYLSRGEAKEANTKARQIILANAIEAVIGAIYLDQGWEASKTLIHRVLLPRLSEIIEKKLYLDPKTKFQEAAQDKVGLTPTYQVLDEHGPDHDKYFKVGIYLGSDLIASGEGTSKQEAQVEAAENGLRAKGW